MKKQRLFTMLLTAALTLGGGTFSVAAETVEFTAEKEHLSKATEEFQDVTLEDGVTYQIKHDGNGSPYYALFGGAGISLDRYVVSDEINGIPVKSLEYGYVARGELVIPNTVTRIEEWCFSEGGPEILSIPDSVTYIGENAFWLSRIKKLKTGNGSRVLEAGVFSDCRYLEEAEIGDRVEKISGGAFIGCNNLKKIVIPPSVKEITGGGFNILPGVTIYGYKNSYAELWAKGMGYTFSQIGEVEQESKEGQPVLTVPAVNGGSITVQIANYSTDLWDGYEYNIDGKEVWTDEDYDITYTGTEKIINKDNVTTAQTTFKYLSPMYYYIQCRGYKNSQNQKVYGAWSMPALAKVTAEKPVPPSFEKLKLKKNKNNTFDVTISLKQNGKWQYDCVLGKTQSSQLLYKEKNVSLDKTVPVKENKPGNYLYVRKNCKQSTVTFKGVKPGT